MRVINIADTVVRIEGSLIASDSTLLSINVAIENSSYSSKEGVLYSKRGDRLIQYPGGKKDEYFIIPDSVRYIDESAFYRNYFLKNIDFPVEMLEIGGAAFSGCTALEFAEIPEGITTISSSLFYNCPSLRAVKIPDSVTKIEPNAFSACYSLQSISISKYVTEMEASFESSSFTACHALEEIVVDKDNPNYMSIDGVLFDKELKTLMRYPPSKPGAYYAIPEGTISIGPGSMQFLKQLQIIQFPDSLKEINYRGFGKSESLESVILNEGLVSIGEEAFWECKKMKEIVIPSTVKIIRSAAFFDCESLERVEFRNESMDYLDTTTFVYTALSVVYGTPGSFAEKYAKISNLPFIPIVDKEK